MSDILAARSLFWRDLKLAWHRRSDALQPIAFAVLVVLLFAITLGGERERLGLMAAPIIWVTVLLANFLSFDHFFREDASDGTLDQWLASGVSLPLLCIAKALAHWLIYGLTLLIATLFLALILSLDVKLLPSLLLSLLIGSFGATQIGLVAAALTARLRRGGILLALIVLPLFLPLLIFGSGAVDAVQSGLPARSALLLLAAQTLLLTTLAPLAAAASLRIGADQPP
jgi:heme exporter protein B